MSETKIVEDEILTWKLGQRGDLDISENGVIRTIKGRALTTYQSANVIVGTQKGSFPFIPDLGIELNYILGSRISQDNYDNFEYLYELISQVNMIDQDPYIIGANGYEFTHDKVNRKTMILFNIIVVGGFQFQVEVNI